ncbi:MAG: PD40 domain-containing protein [Phycisphaerales bacterium]|nr:PD40 domain-containing protein [Phycisphaerales bacterium]
MSLIPRLSAVVLLLLAVGLSVPTARADVQPHARMLQSPDVSATHIVFRYANDLWIVPRSGGVASPLANPAGVEWFPRFSPDGQSIAYMANYDGNTDLYVIPITGGVPQRVTHHPVTEMLSDWTPDGRLIFHAQRVQDSLYFEMFTVAATGGLPEKLPVPYGGNGTISADGVWLAYTPSVADQRTWKRYKGGMHADVWVFNLQDHSARRLTDWSGTDSLPMWHDGKLYFVSDAGSDHRLNLWEYDLATDQQRQLTHYKDFDVRWPAMGPGATGEGEIVFQLGSELYLFDLATEQPTAVQVTIPGDRPTLRPQRANARENIDSWGLSATGKRVVLAARGDIWSVPAKEGVPHNFTRTSGAAERDPAWSPDGRWIAYFSDETGEYQLYVTSSDGKGAARKLTDLGAGFRLMRGWSPDSKHIAFADNFGTLYLCAVESGELTQLEREPSGNAPGLSWSHDSRWIAYARTGANRQRALWLYEVETGVKHQVTRGMTDENAPTFDRKGDWLFYTSSLNVEAPIYSAMDESFVYASTGALLAVPLRADVKHPWLPKNDMEEWKDDKKKEDEGQHDEMNESPADDDEAAESAPGNDADPDDETGADSAPATAPATQPDDAKKKDGEKQPREKVEILLEGFEARAIVLPVGRGTYYGLAVNDENHLLYLRRGPPGARDGTELKIFNLGDEKKEEKTVLADVGGYDLSADGKKVLVRKGNKFHIVEARAGQKTDEAVPADELHVLIDPRAEWRQLVRDTWRIFRDYFYVENLHAVDWYGQYEQYAALLDDCISRDDVAYIIREMISELNVGHAYYHVGMHEAAPVSLSVGLLGADFALENGAYRIARILGGAPWDADARSPLALPGVDVKVGEYLLAVNGVPLDPTRDPWAAFQGLAGKTVQLTMSATPTMDDEARTVLVQPLDSDAGLRYRTWVETKRLYVEERTGGQVGYIHVPNTGIQGQNELFRQFQGQMHTAALIIDERWNGGGQIPTRFIELLNRPQLNAWAVRADMDWPTPGFAHFGPKCMLINGWAGSGGDMFPALFRQVGLGKLIGARTWGGLVGISGNPRLIDGTGISVPTFGYYKLDGTWGIEGHGVDPDLEVIDDPSKMVAGGDPQLDAAIAHLLDEVKRNPYVPPTRPADPDRRGMGIRPEDR